MNLQLVYKVYVWVSGWVIITIVWRLVYFTEETGRKHPTKRGKERDYNLVTGAPWASQ